MCSHDHNIIWERSLPDKKPAWSPKTQLPSTSRFYSESSACLCVKTQNVQALQQLIVPHPIMLLCIYLSVGIFRQQRHSFFNYLFFESCDKAHLHLSDRIIVDYVSGKLVSWFSYLLLQTRCHLVDPSSGLILWLIWVCQIKVVHDTRSSDQPAVNQSSCISFPFWNDCLCLKAV